MMQAIPRRRRDCARPATLELSGAPRPFLRSVRGRVTGGLGNCRRGAIAVEFVLACVPLMVLIFGFIATSAVFTTLGSMQGNAQYAARMMSTGQITRNNAGALSTTNTTATVTCSSSLASTQVEYYACTGLPTWATFTVTSTENCAVPSVTVSLSANAATAAIADVENFFSGKTIVAQSVMMREGGTCP
jgi:Flp pilus assembly protein TadG